MDAATRGARGTLLQVAVRDVKLYSENEVLCSVEKVLHAACRPKERLSERARGPLYIEEIRALERRAPAAAADGLEAYGMKEAFVA